MSDLTYDTISLPNSSKMAEVSNSIQMFGKEGIFSPSVGKNMKGTVYRAAADDLGAHSSGLTSVNVGCIIWSISPLEPRKHVPYIFKLCRKPLACYIPTVVKETVHRLIY